jgi:hypothetical protein
MNILEVLRKVKYRDGLWKRRVVEYWLWCDETTEEICKILKISRPLLNQWHRWHFKTRNKCHHKIKTSIKEASLELSPALILWQKRQQMKNQKLEEKQKADSENVALLQQQIESLKTALKAEQLRSEAMSTMIDIAEDVYKIEIRKKSGAKQLKP